MLIYSFIISWFSHGAVYDDNYVHIYFLYTKKGGGGMVSKHGKFGLMNLKYSGHGLV